MPFYLIILVKTTVSSIVLFIFARIMGKKQVAQLTYFDYIVGISIGSIAAVLSVDRSVPIMDGLISMLVWTSFAILFSTISLKSMIARRWFDGVPTILVQNGKIVEKNLKRVRFTVNDLLEELRIKDVFNLTDVEYAILETNGKLSVLKKAEKQPVTPMDMGLKTSKTGIYGNVIIDGNFMEQNMKQLNVDKTWLANELAKNNIDVKDVLLACINTKGELHIDKKHQDPDDLNVLQ